jgi:hypothetical protein
VLSGTLLFPVLLRIVLINNNGDELLTLLGVGGVLKCEVFPLLKEVQKNRISDLNAQNKYLKMAVSIFPRAE